MPSLSKKLINLFLATCLITGCSSHKESVSFSPYISANSSSEDIIINTQEPPAHSNPVSTADTETNLKLTISMPENDAISSQIGDVVNVLTTCKSQNDVLMFFGSPQKTSMYDAVIETNERWLYTLINDKDYEYPYSDLRLDIDAFKSGEVSLLLAVSFNASNEPEGAYFYYVGEDEVIQYSYFALHNDEKREGIDYAFFSPSEFDLAIPFEQELISFRKQDILRFFTGGGLTTCCTIDFGSFELTFVYEGKDIDIVSNPSAAGFSVKEYRDLPDAGSWRIIETDIKEVGYKTLRNIGIGDSEADVLRAYETLGICKMTESLTNMGVDSTFGIDDDTQQKAVDLLYVDNRFVFTPACLGQIEAASDGARALIFLFNEEGYVERIVSYYPTAG